MKIGFIGCGNMAGAMIGGILSAGLVEADHIMASAKSRETKERIRSKLGIREGSNREVAGFADVLVLAVKPVYYEEVLREIASDLREETVLVSIAPGKNMDWFREVLGREVRLVRSMPNTPALSGEGMTGMCRNALVTEEDAGVVRSLFESFGRVEEVPEHLLDVVTAVSGSSPAYIFMVIEAMADGAVAEGMPRSQAYRFAAQAVLGSAKMVLDTGMHPGALKDMVCSPGGTTIEAVRVLEEKGLRSALIEAEKACVKKSRQV